MNMTDEFLRLMRTQREIALATSADNTPHVRIVNFIYVPEEGRIYFATFADNTKVSEIAANPAVSFTTIPHDGSTAHVRAVGRAVRSERSIFEYADAFAAKIPGYDETIAAVGSELLLYEITFDTAAVTVDMEHSGTVCL
ncbi:pyridoxamine 5'-phosphate oxidase family protein [Selenomonas noxia]|uniref:pyridoxamine 5'-phosphate oxidase family protein n=1 Tax=Selenomonas noxia TaxID=135083 RepID=UPI003C769849